MNTTENYIEVNVLLKDGSKGIKILCIVGTLFEMPEIPGFIFAANQRLEEDDTGLDWRVTEVSSGMVFCYSKTKEGLVKAARMRLERYGVTGCTKTINTAIEYYEQKKKKIREGAQ